MTAGAARCALALALRAVAVWLLLMAVETAHGTVRTLLVAPYIGDFSARQVSVLSASVLILLTAYLTGRWLRAETTRAQLLVGGLWLALTLLFELGVGRYVVGYSWERLAAEYDLARGGLLPFGMAVLTLAPWAAAQLRARTATATHNSAPATHHTPPGHGAPSPG